MRTNALPCRALPALFLLLTAWSLLVAGPSAAAGPVRVEAGPLAGDLTPPAGWVPGGTAGTDLATKLLEQDGVRERPVLSFLKGESQVVFATTKEIEGAVLTAADLAAGGSELARALGIAPAAMQCNAFPHPSGSFEFSICETIAAGTGLAVTGKGRPTAAIWVDIPLAYDGPSGVTNTWTSIYFRGPGAAMESGHEVVEALLDALVPKTGLRLVAAGTAADRAGGGAAMEPAPAAPPPAPATDGQRLAEILARGLAEKPTPVDVAALRSVAEAYSGTVLGEVAADSARDAAARIALSTWEDLLANNPGDAPLRSLALRFFGAALRAADTETMEATAKWLAEHRSSLAELPSQELAMVFPAGDLCAAPRGDLPKSARDLGALDGSKNDSGRRIVELFRSRGLAVPDMSTVAVANTSAGRPRGDRRGVPQVMVVDGRLGAFTPKNPARLKAGYEFQPFDNVFDALERLCRAKPV